MAAAAAALNPALQNRAQPGAGDYKTYFGDLHNHNAVGYAQGSLERTFEIARNHLDFFAFTPHGHWHDIGHYENKIEERLHLRPRFRSPRASKNSPNRERRFSLEIFPESPPWSIAWFSPKTTRRPTA
jgi:hypothetical protein